NPRRGSVAEVAAYRDAAGEVHELIDRRVLLECGAAHLAATRAGPAEVERVRELVEGMDRVGSWADFHRLDEQFHLTLAAASGLASAVEGYGATLRELYRYYLPYPLEYLRESNAEHRALVEAVAGRDPIAAADVARRHVEVLHETMFVGLMDRRGEERLSRRRRRRTRAPGRRRGRTAPAPGPGAPGRGRRTRGRTRRAGNPPTR